LPSDVDKEQTGNAKGIIVKFTETSYRDENPGHDKRIHVCVINPFLIDTGIAKKSLLELTHMFQQKVIDGVPAGMGLFDALREAATILFLNTHDPETPVDENANQQQPDKRLDKKLDKLATDFTDAFAKLQKNLTEGLRTNGVRKNPENLLIGKIFSEVQSVQDGGKEISEKKWCIKDIKMEQSTKRFYDHADVPDEKPHKAVECLLTCIDDFLGDIDNKFGKHHRDTAL